MKEIFVSRPTIVDSVYDASIRELDNFLYRNELKPITMGVNTYTFESPIVAIKSKMQECSGLIILGLPKMFVKNAKILNKTAENEIIKVSITNKNFPTAWNQIEGTMAYMLELPIMIITEEGIDDGLLDRSTLNLFQQTYNLKNDKWLLHESFKGTFDSWKASLK